MEIKFKIWDCILVKSTYRNGNKALMLIEKETGEDIATCTVNLPELEPNEIAIKNYSENEGMYQTLLDANVIYPAHRYLSSNYITNIPVCFERN